MKKSSTCTQWIAGIVLVFICLEGLVSPTAATIQSYGQHYQSPAIPLNSNHRQTFYVGGEGPNNYTKIQDAVDNASDGDMVYVYHGTYYEHVLITKQVSLIGESRDQTIIDGGGPGNVIKIQANEVTVTQLTLQNAGIGVYIVSSSDCSILYNTIIDNWEGIGLLTSSYCLISGNTIAHNGFEGINPVQTTFTTISDNSIIDHLQGIYFVESTDNTIYGNTLSSNSRGIELQESSNNNHFFHNNFYASEENNAYDTCSNNWDDDYPSGGNHWDDYNGGDANHDGIGDTPYNIPGGGGNKDYYPLMSAWGHPPSQPSDPDPTDGAINVPVNPVLSVFVYDADLDTLDVSFYDATTQLLIGSDTDVASATRATVPWYGLENNTTYTWYAVADDGTQTNQSATWVFTTGDGANQPPVTPTIHGPTTGNAGQNYTYTFLSTDPEEDSILYYVDWGDSTNTGWIGPFQSGEQMNLTHVWTNRGMYTIKAKAKDVNDAESTWGTLGVRMPKSQTQTGSVLLFFFERLFERFPLAFALVQYLFSSHRSW